MSAIKRLAPRLAGPELALVLCYAAGVLAGRLLGEGAVGQPLLALAAPAALGVAVRAGRLLGAADALRLSVVHAVIAVVAGDAPPVWALALAQDLIMIATGALMFRRLRSARLIVSPSRVAAAVAAVALVAPLGAVALWIAAGAGDAPAGAAAVTRYLADAVGIALTLGVTLTWGRRRRAALLVGFEEEAPMPQPWEYAVAALLLGVLTTASVIGRPEAALAGSATLLWFALRLGPSATAAAAFGFTVALLAFSSRGLFPVALPAGPVESEILRYLAVLLLAAPSVAVAAFVHDQDRQKRQFAYRATHDGLTALVNRSRFLEVLDKASRAAAESGERFLLLLIDLDHFKQVNDGFGHARGDRLLVEVATRLRRSVRATDVVARIGGDEFAVIAPVPAIDDAMRLARRLVESVNRPCELDGVALVPSVTVGGVLSPDAATDPTRLMLLADEALYRAKAAGRNCWRFASEEQPLGLASIWTLGDIEGPRETVLLD